MNTVAKEIDVRGYNCPVPLLRAKKALATMRPGELLRILATDPGAEIDFKVFSEASGNPLIALEETGGVITILLEKHA
jgi:tRNA 2-thiouridine synthesizing protein A